MTITPEQLAELEKALAKQNAYEVAQDYDSDGALEARLYIGALLDDNAEDLIKAARELDSLKWKAGLKIQQMDREITGLQKQIVAFMEREKTIVDILVPKQSEGSLADVVLKAIEPSAPPGCDFPDPPVEEKSAFILDHPDPA